MNKLAGLSNLKEFLFIFSVMFFCSVVLVNADVISTNPTGSLEHAMTPERYIEGFFFGQNTAPVISNVILNSSSGGNKTTENLTCYAKLSDIDGNSMHALVKWYDYLGLNQTLEYNNSYISGTTFISTLTSGNLSHGDVWMCSVNAYDGTTWGEWTNSSSLLVLNTPPTISLYAPEDGNITTNRMPTFYWNGSDIDGDTLTYELNLTCYNALGGTCSDDNRFISGIVAQSYTLTEYLEYLKDNNYYYNWTARAYDGALYSPWAIPRKIEIQSSLDVVLINDAISFGQIAMAGTNNTATDNPPPFSLQNNGNCFANVSINATALWQSVTTDSETYKFKVDNATGEEGAFEWLASKVSWTQMPITGQVVAISELNFSDTKDLAEVDVLVTVPGEEPAGDRQSTVYFPVSLGE